jgi:CheY-like chemotaxis protein
MTSNPRSVLALCANLMDRSRLEAAVPGVVVVRDAQAALEAVATSDVVVIDLAHPDALDVIAATAACGVRAVAYGAHVDREGLAAAMRAGCDRVLARSAFFARPVDYIAERP